MKNCSKCGQTKPLIEFRQDKQGRNTNHKTYYRPECKQCESKLRKQLAIAKRNATPKPDRCECCGIVTEKIVVDHDHLTGMFRGWLCEKCNVGMGKFNDDVKKLKKAVKYLRGPWYKRFYERIVS